MDSFKKKEKILWFISEFGAGSGGHRTIFQNVEYLIRNGYECDFFINSKTGPEIIRQNILQFYNIKFEGDIICDGKIEKDYDLAVATYYATVKDVVKCSIKRKVYFVQDYEPWFFPMSEEYLEARKSYTYGLNVITIGKWLAREIHDEFDVKTKYFDFCADLEVYHCNKNVKKEKAVCFVLQPDKPRRCARMGLRALQIVKAMRPDIKIYLFGSEKKIPFNIEAEHLGLLSVEDCNELYNRCMVGLSLSSTNPSRIPFEMMAAGLPVVDLYLENNLYDFSDDGCLLAEPSAEALATSIIKIIDDDVLREKLARGGDSYMRSYPLERGFDEFGDAIKRYLDGRRDKDALTEVVYRRAAVKPKPNIVLEKEVQEAFFRSEEEIKAEKAAAELLRKEKEWRENLTIPQRIYLKIRYKLIGK